MILIKKCKGEAKAKGFGCGAETPVQERKFGLGFKCGCWKKWLQETDAGNDHVIKSTIQGKRKLEKEKKEIVKEANKKTQAEKDAIKNWGAELQKVINSIARILDVGLLCLARGYAGQMQGGHIFSRGSNSSMKFHLHNIHRQCAQSNGTQNDDGLLRENLAREYGPDYLEYVANLRRMKTLDLKNWELQELQKKALKIATRLKKENLYYSLDERIEKRNEINLELGIYPAEFCEFKRN